MAYKKLMFGAAVTGVTFASVLGAAVASAQTNAAGGTSLAQKIAQKFSISQDEVQKVLDEDRDSHEAEHAQRETDRLQAAVDAGKLTAAQKDLIVAKRAEMKTSMDSLKDKTEEERRTAMEQGRTDLKQWATDNGIPEEYIMMGHGGPGGGRMGGRGGFDGVKPEDAPDAADDSAQTESN
jgi:cell division protein FtsN